MVKINPNYSKLKAGYLFPEIARRTKAFVDANQGVKIFRLGIGDTTEPITPHVLTGLREGVEMLGKVETYKGYGPEQGNLQLREALVNFYRRRGVALEADEIFVSDGAKPDTANIQSIFASDNVVAVQDPAYPVYVDTNVVAGRAGDFVVGAAQYSNLVYMPCNEQNGFIPNQPKERVDLIYLCSPNNPTGAVMPRESLEEFVDYAREKRSVIIFDAAYSWFIGDDSLPQSIYEIDGARECAIEINSFSKMAGFTGVRLGWTVVPKSLVAEDAEAGVLNRMWNRHQTTFFNGASVIAQYGGIAALSSQGMVESKRLVDFYKENARIIMAGLESKGIRTFNGNNAPYVWMQNPDNMNSWNFFNKLLTEAHVVTTPGSGFGPSGEGFTRLSAFGHRENVEAAMQSIKENLKL